MPSLFSILCDEATLYAAWNLIHSKGSAGGIDGIGIEAFHEGRRKEIPRLAKELAHGSSGFFRNSFFFAKNSPVLRKICNFAPRKWLNNNTRFSQVVSGMVCGGFSCEIF